MAVVTTKKDDSKYAHLKKVYNKREELVDDKESQEEEIVFKSEETIIDKKEFTKLAVIILILGIAGLSGYLLFRFL